MDIKEAAQIDAAEQSDGDIAADGSGSTARRRVVVGGLSAAALSVVPFLTRRAGASGRNVAATSSSSSGNTFTNNSTDSLNNDPTGASTAASTSGSGASTGSGSGATPGSDGGFNGTGDSTNASSDITIGGSAGSTADTTGDTEAATTTTAPPKRPTDADVTTLSFVQSMELAIRDLYDLAIDLGTFSGAQGETINAIRDDHAAYAQSISGLLGRSAPNAPLADLVSKLKADFSGSADAMLKAARTLENDAAATHTEVLGTLVGVDATSIIASILVVEARHATVLANFAGVADLDDQLADDGKALSASDYTK
ncbi:MAG: hypothetical protein JWM34_1395 [Ilumatobacteraceae bacterium]|nr:hypothetical protein [Ilumatobacteraceae bacterium]